MLSLVTYNKMLSQIKKLSLANKNKFSVEKIAKKIILLAMVYKGKYSYIDVYDKCPNTSSIIQLA